MGEKLRYSGFSRHFALSFFRSDLNRDQPEAATEHHPSTLRVEAPRAIRTPSSCVRRGTVEVEEPYTPADGEDERPLYISTLNERWKPSSASSAALTCRSFPRK